MKKLLPIALVLSSTVFAKPVNINNADAQTLSDSLTGVSLKKAQAIVANREKYGAFKNVDDLKRVIGIGEKTIAVNRANIFLADSEVPVVSQPHKSAEKNSIRIASQNINLITVYSIIALLLIAVVTMLVNQYQKKKRKTQSRC